MITIKKDKLIITIHDPSPRERKNWLIEAIAAAIKWRAYFKDNCKADENNLHVLSDLLTELSRDNSCLKETWE